MQRTRRRFLIAAGALAAAPLARAQKPEKPRRIGFLCGLPAAYKRALWAQEVLRGGLQAAGYEVDRHIVIEWRWADGDATRLSALADDLVRREVELIVAWSNDEISAAMRATRTIPIVMLFGVAPVEVGFVESLARPGGNVTGTAWSSPETFAKALQILKEAKPTAVRIAILADPSTPGIARFRSENDRAARALGLSLERFDAAHPDQVPAALERISASRSDALYVVGSPVVETRLREIGAFALRHKLVSIATTPSFVLDAEGLVSYAPIALDLVDRAVTHIDRILRGAKPADLPIDLPAKFALLVNARTARAIGFSVPHGLLLRASQVIDH